MADNVIPFPAPLAVPPPERLAEIFAVADALAAERGLPPELWVVPPA